MNTLTPQQHRAITHSTGHLQLVACAGSGKTEVLAQRVSHLLTPGGGVRPHEVVAFTFTDRAAVELRDRVRARCRAAHGEVPGLNELFVGTMHGYCLDLLRRMRPEYLKFTMLNQVQQHLLIDRHSRECGLADATDLKGVGLRRFIDTPHFASAMSLFRESALVADELRACSVYEALPDYLDVLRRRAFFDFAGVLAEAVSLLESDAETRSRVRGQVRHLLVDEYQDTNPVQERLVRAMHDLGVQICVVGDDDQTIYQFRGGDVRHIQNFCTRYADVTSIRLEDNFRSSEAVVAVARSVVEAASERLPKAMRAACAQRFEPGDLSAVELSNPDAEAEHIAASMLALRGVAFTDGGVTRGLDWSDMAVLCRSVKAIGAPIVSALARRGIPAVVVGMGGLFDAPEAQAARTLFCYLAGKPDVTAGSLAECWREADLGLVPGALASAVAHATTVRERILRDDSGRVRHDHYGLQRTYWSFLSQIGLREDRVPNGRGEVVFYNLGRFSQIVSDFETVNFHTAPATKYPRFADFLVYSAEKAYGEGAPDERMTAPNAVRVMTVHQAKGLQWPVVFVPGLGRNRFPMAGVGGRTVWHLVPETAVVGQSRYEGSEDDERRLMYVALTRSQKFLHLSWAPIDGVARYRKPSVFFSELSASPWVSRTASTFGERPRSEPRPAQRAEKLEVGYSDFQHYLDCPYAYKLRVLCGFNPPLHEALGYGQSVHNALAELHDRWLRGESVGPEDVPDLVDRHLHLPYAFESLRQSLRAAALDALRSYVPGARRAAGAIRANETPVTLDVGSGVTVAGRIDQLRAVASGGLELLDFKTSRGAAAREAVDTQLRVYALGWADSGATPPSRLTVHDLTNGTVQTVPITMEDLASTRAQLIEAASRLRAGNFSRCGDARRCEGCDLLSLCSATTIQAPEVRHPRRAVG